MRARLLFLPLSLFFLQAITPEALEAKSRGRITGKVKSDDGEGLLGAIVTIFKQDRDGGSISFTRSGRQGSYTITDLAPGSYYLQVSREGFQPLTQSNVKIDSGKTTTLDMVLQELLGFVLGDKDPRNWDLNTVLRSTSDRRLIFRNLPGVNSESQTGTSSAEAFEDPPSFARSATVNLASSAGLSTENYSVFPSNGHNGIISNFAFGELVGEHGRMIFAGQMNSGYDSLWRVRNTYEYRGEHGRDLSLSVGYGRLNLNDPGMGVMGRPTQFFNRDPLLRESGVQTIALGFEARTRILDPIALKYGFDYSRVTYGTTKSVFSPLVQLIINPADSWTLKAALTSRRISDNNLVILPDGEMVNLMEPTYIAQIDGDIHISQFNHAEIAVAKSLADMTSMEFAVYEDHMNGPGTPFLVTRNTRQGRSSQVSQLREDQTAQRGMRVAMNRRFLDFLSGSIVYVYGTGTMASNTEESASSDVLARDLLNHIQRSYYHSFTSQVNATFPRTRTSFTSVLRWYPGSTLSPIDLFFDQKDTLTKGVNFFIRQGIPLPEFMGTAGRWEALVDVRNLFDQGKGRLLTNDGELILTRNPRSVRFGLNLNFY